MGSSICIANDTVKLAFGLENGLFAFEQMQFIPDGMEFAAAKQPVLWKVEMISRSGEINILQPECMPQVKEDAESLEMTWQYPGFGDVTVCVELKATSDAAEMRLKVDNVDPEQSVRIVHFPCFDWLLTEGNDCKLIQPEDAGCVFPDPLKTLPSGGIIERKKIRARAWPNGALSMQFMALERSGNLIYLGAHDMTYSVKSFNWECDRENPRITFRPFIHAIRQEGASYITPFPWIMALSYGDWFDAAMRYREYALKAPWLNKGPLEHGKKTPQWYMEMPLVTLRASRGEGFAAEDLIAEAEYFGVPLLVHYYMWGKNIPKHFPTTHDYRKEVKKLANAGVRVMPYMDIYSLDVAHPLWDNFADQAINVDEKGTIHGTAWPPDSHNLVTMCTQAPMWRHFGKSDLLRMLETGVAGIYLDEFGMSPAHTCCATNHNHLPGDPTVYVGSTNSLLKEVKEESQDIYPEKIIFTSEGAGEPYISDMDSFLIGNGNSPYMKPIFSAVYHDYVMGFGRYIFFTELTDPAFEDSTLTKMAEQFICGWQFGWSRIPWHMYISKMPETAAFVRMLAQIRHEHWKHLACGKMLKPLELNVPKVQRRWARAWNDQTGTVVELPAVMNSAWQCDDASTKVFFVNILNEEVSFDYSMYTVQLEQTVDFNNAKKTVNIPQQPKKTKYTYPMPEPSPCYGTLYTIDGKTETSIMDGDTRSGFKITLPPRSVLVQRINNALNYGKVHWN